MSYEHILVIGVVIYLGIVDIRSGGRSSSSLLGNNTSHFIWHSSYPTTTHYETAYGASRGYSVNRSMACQFSESTRDCQCDVGVM